VAVDKDQVKIVVSNITDKPGSAARVFRTLADANIVVDMIVQNVGRQGVANLTFTVPKGDKAKAVNALTPVLQEIGGGQVTVHEQIAKLSVVGVGMKTHSGVAATLFQALADAGINIELISTSEIKISVIVALEKADEARASPMRPLSPRAAPARRGNAEVPCVSFPPAGRRRRWASPTPWPPAWRRTGASSCRRRCPASRPRTSPGWRRSATRTSPSTSWAGSRPTSAGGTAGAGRAILRGLSGRGHRPARAAGRAHLRARALPRADPRLQGLRPPVARAPLRAPVRPARRVASMRWGPPPGTRAPPRSTA